MVPKWVEGLDFVNEVLACEIRVQRMDPEIISENRPKGLFS